jgi:ATP-dependent protease ClpP protease subunit
MKIDVKGAIVSNSDKWIYEWFEMDATAPRDVETQIKKAAFGEEIEVEINSGGGDVYAGSEIYTALKSYTGNVVVKIVGIAASAASVIAMSGKKVLMSPTAQFMIHNVWSMAAGDYRDFEHEAEVLKGHNASIANAYMLKTGMKQKELLDLMNKESYFNAQQALKNKFIDEIMFNDQMQLVASASSNMIPKEIVNKMRDFLKQNEKQKDLKPKQDLMLMQAKINLLKLMEVRG